MAAEALLVRLNDREYTNWLKAGRFLLILKDALHPFANARMVSLHRRLLDADRLLQKHCPSSCKPRKNKLSWACPGCSRWQTEIMKHHRQPDVTVHWDNCFPPAWRTSHWELAKAYMPRGQAKVKEARQCDASALLNLINYCDCFTSVEPQHVREVIRCRNELMHSCELRVKDEWMRNYHRTLKHFMRNLREVPQMATAEHEINQMLSVDLSICVSGLDRLDSAADLQHDSIGQTLTNADIISQWETELLQERLREFLDAAAGDDTMTLDTQRSGLAGFLQAHRDLGERFSAELQTISSLEAERAKS